MAAPLQGRGTATPSPAAGTAAATHAASNGVQFRAAFTKIAARSATAVGSPWAFLSAVAVIIIWVVSGPLFHFSDTWQLVINTGTTIITFLMVFLIQNTQNRDAKALHLKVDELIRAVRSAQNELIDIEEDTEEELEQLQQRFRELHRQAATRADPKR